MELFGYTLIRTTDLTNLKGELTDTRRALAEQVNNNGRLVNQINRLRLLMRNEGVDAQTSDSQRPQS